MRNYAKVAPSFWIGETGRALRAAGRDAQLLALYLVTCPAASMSGLFYLPLSTITEESGLPPEVVRKTLQTLKRLRFAYFDERTSTVFLPEMARYQIGEELSPGDKRIPGLVRELHPMRGSPYFSKFFEKYA